MSALVARVRGLNVLLGVCVLLTLGLGVAKLAVQRERPPPHAREQRNTYEGFVSIDRYCERAELFRDWIEGVGGGRQALIHDVVHGYHPTVLLVPLAVGVSSRAVGSIPITFALYSAGAFLVQVVLVLRLARSLAPSAGETAARTMALTGGILFAAHVDSVRSAAQLLMDPFVGCLGTAAVLLSLARLRGARTAPLLVLVQLLGTFIKLSYAPFLAVPAIVTLVAGRGTGWSRWRSAAADGVRFGLLPALPALSFVLLLVGQATSSLSGELGRATGAYSFTPRHLGRFAIEMALLLQAFPLALALARRATLAPETRAVLASAGLYLVSMWSLGLAHDYRLYVPLLGLLAAGCAPSVVAATGRRHFYVLLAYVGGNEGLALVGLELGM